MKEKELRRSMAVFTIGTVMKLTDLTARQIRYYEEQNLIQPERNEGNRRMFSLNDVDALLEIKDYIAEGINMAGIKRIYEFKKIEKPVTSEKESNNYALTDDDVRRILHSEFLSMSGFNQNNKTQFIDPNRFF
ncbi:MAG: MerR family transcriptional regulator [Carnobacterium sp.]